MATGMNYDFLYQSSSSSIHQPHVPGSDPSLATEIMPAPPPLSAFPRVNGKGQTIVRAPKSSQKKRGSAMGTVVALSPIITHAEQQQVAATTLQATCGSGYEKCGIAIARCRRGNGAASKKQKQQRVN